MACSDACLSEEQLQSLATIPVIDEKRERISTGFDVKLVKPDSCRDGDECPICTFIVKQPVMVTTCGHIFCRNCLMEWIREKEVSNDKPRCPADNEEIAREDVVPDKARERAVLDFRVYCKNENLGCLSTPELRDYEAHIKDCEYYFVFCPLLCGEKIIKRSEGEHMVQQCLKRIVDCSICGDRVIFDSHIDVCPLVKVTCVYCSNEDIFRKELDDHVNKDCLKYPTYCGFALFGCDSKIPRHQLAKHHEESWQLHANLLSRATQQLFETVGESFPLAQAKEDVMSTFASLELPLNSRQILDDKIVECNQAGGDTKDDSVFELENKSLRKEIFVQRGELVKLHGIISDLKKDFETLTVKLNEADNNISELKKNNEILQNEAYKTISELKKDNETERIKQNEKFNRSIAKLRGQLRQSFQKDVLVELSDDGDKWYLCPLEWRVELKKGMSERLPGVGCYSKVGGYFFSLLVKCSSEGGFDIICRLLKQTNYDTLDWPYPGGEMLEVRAARSNKVLGSDSTPSVEGRVQPTETFGKPLFTVHLVPPYVPYTIIVIIKKIED